MIKRMIALAAAFVMMAALSACGSEPVPAQESVTPDVSVLPASPSASETAAPEVVKTYKDGTYEYVGKNDIEGYHVEGTMVISGGAIQSMEWKIVDSNGRVFDETYEEEFTGIELYIQQCRDNWSGLQTFVPALIVTQDPNKVDAVSGATWAYKKFRHAAMALLEQASQ